MLRATFECARDAETEAEFEFELAEAVEELRSRSIDPLVEAALIDTHDDKHGFRRGKKKNKEEAAREAADIGRGGRNFGPLSTSS